MDGWIRRKTWSASSSCSARTAVAMWLTRSTALWRWPRRPSNGEHKSRATPSSRTSSRESRGLPRLTQQEIVKLDYPRICAGSGDLLHQAVLAFIKPMRPFAIADTRYQSSRPGHTHRREAIRSSTLTVPENKLLGYPCFRYVQSGKIVSAVRKGCRLAKRRLSLSWIRKVIQLILFVASTPAWTPQVRELGQRERGSPTEQSKGLYAQPGTVRPSGLAGVPARCPTC